VDANRRLLLIAVVMLWSSNTYAADVDPASFLNSVLAAKQLMVKKTRQVDVQQIICTWVGEGGHRTRDCQNLTHQEPRQYTDNARVTGSQVIEVENLLFSFSKMTELPERILEQREDYYNCGEGPFTVSNSIGVTGTRSTTVTKTQTVSASTTMTLTTSGTVNAGFASATTSFAIGLTIGISSATATAETQTDSEARTFGVSITLNPGQSGYSVIDAVQTAIDIPYSASVIVDGALESNDSGYNTASQLLSEADRTISVSGTLHALGVSNAVAGNMPPDTPLDCKNPLHAGKQVLITPAAQTNSPISPSPTPK